MLSTGRRNIEGIIYIRETQMNSETRFLFGDEERERKVDLYNRIRGIGDKKLELYASYRAL